jgi:hypothetical protein
LYLKYDAFMNILRVVTSQSKVIILPDMLSRMSTEICSTEDEIEVNFVLQETEMFLFKNIQTHTKTSKLSQIITFKVIITLYKNKSEYTVHNGCLYRGFRLLVLPVLRP